MKPVGCDQTLAIYKVMNAAKFDGGGIGNHEFNYGLPYLSQVTGNTFEVDACRRRPSRKVRANFPQVLANVISAKTNAPLFTPYTI